MRSKIIASTPAQWPYVNTDAVTPGHLTARKTTEEQTEGGRGGGVCVCFTYRYLKKTSWWQMVMCNFPLVMRARLIFELTLSCSSLLFFYRAQAQFQAAASRHKKSVVQFSYSNHFVQNSSFRTAGLNAVANSWQTPKDLL